MTTHASPTRLARVSILGVLLAGCFGTVSADPVAIFEARDYGARGDGVALDSEGINRAIDACTHAGGGTVRLAAGTYRAGTICLKDNVSLVLDRYAVLIGSKDLSDYRTAVYPQGQNEAFIYAQGAQHVAVTGEGAIDGNTVFNPNGEEHMRGPHALVFQDCRDVTVRGIRIRNSSNWAVMLWSCQGVVVEGIEIRGGWDGVNMHDVKDATIARCRFFTGDDCLAGSYWENVAVHDCVLNSSANAIRVAGRNVTFTDCSIYGPGEYAAGSSLRHRTEAGFQILPNRANARNKYAALGPADNIVLSHVTMMNVGTPVWIDSSGDSAYNTHNLGIGRIVFNDVRVSGAGRTPFYVAANLDSPAKSIVLNRVRMSFVGGGDEAQAEGQGFSPFSILQSYGLYCRNVERVELHDVAIECERTDRRPPLMMENVGTLELDRVSAERAVGTAPLLEGSDVRRLIVDGRAVGEAPARAEGVTLPPTIAAGDPFALSVTVRGAGAPAWRAVPLRIGQSETERRVLLAGDETAVISFLNLRRALPGRVAIEVLGLARTIEIGPRPPGGAVAPPFRVFHNTETLIERSGAGFFIRAGGDHPVLQQGDQYAAVYLPKALREKGTIVVRLENPDLRTSWMGRAGIVVRNAIAQPGRADGYVALGSSPAAGSYLEWESDGQGRLDRHTDFDGYSVWPHWLKLERNGSRFDGFCSVDGKDWTPIGSADVPGANPMIDAGIFAFRDSARFEDFRIEP